MCTFVGSIRVLTDLECLNVSLNDVIWLNYEKTFSVEFLFTSVLIGLESVMAITGALPLWCLSF